MGSLAPSSRDLAQTMARALGRFDQAVELGPGTGSITRAILERLPREGSLLALETDHALRQGLAWTLTDPRLRVEARGAEHLVQVLRGRRVPRIVSGLPFQLLGEAAGSRILAAARQSLTPGGRFVAFQYGLRALPFFRAHFRRVRVVGPVWRNLPPAHLFLCQP
jgi:phospholipid N-methyltransferase